MMIHLTGVSLYENEEVNAPISLPVDRILAVTAATPASQKARGFTYGAEIALDAINGVFCTAEDYSTVLRLINNANNESDEDHL